MFFCGIMQNVNKVTIIIIKLNVIDFFAGLYYMKLDLPMYSCQILQHPESNQIK